MGDPTRDDLIRIYAALYRCGVEEVTCDQWDTGPESVGLELHHDECDRFMVAGSTEQEVYTKALARLTREAAVRTASGRATEAELARLGVQPGKAPAVRDARWLAVYGAAYVHLCFGDWAGHGGEPNRSARKDYVEQAEAIADAEQEARNG